MDSVVEITKELVELNSENPPGREIEVAKYINDYLIDLKIDSEVLEFEKGRANVVGFVGNGNGLMLNGHIDTVPIGDRKLWSHGPDTEIIDGKLYGRGTTDMKGGVAAVLSALSRSNLKHAKKKLLLVFVADEEVNFAGSTWLLKNKREIFKGTRYGVIAEPTDLKIQIAQKGLIGIKLKFKGRAAHGSTPELGNNAILKATEFVNKLSTSAANHKTKDQFLGTGTINIGKIVGGTAENVVPEFCYVYIDRRIVPGETTTGAIKQIKDMVNRVDKNTEFEIEFARDAFRLSDKSEIVKLLGSVTVAKMIGATGYTEAELYKKEAGIDCVVFGPGKKELSHKASEYVVVEDLKKASAIFEKLIAKWIT